MSAMSTPWDKAHQQQQQQLRLHPVEFVLMDPPKEASSSGCSSNKSIAQIVLSIPLSALLYKSKIVPVISAPEAEIRNIFSPSVSLSSGAVELQ